MDYEVNQSKEILINHVASHGNFVRPSENRRHKHKRDLFKDAIHKMYLKWTLTSPIESF